MLISVGLSQHLTKDTFKYTIANFLRFKRCATRV